MSKIIILGAGTWGVALAKTLAQQDVTVWSVLEKEIEQLKSTYKHKNLVGVDLPHSLKFTTDLHCATTAEFVVVAVPSIFVRQTVHRLKDIISENAIIINVAKGIEKGSLNLLSDVIYSELPNNPLVVLSGPTHAEEVAMDMPTTIISASNNLEYARIVANLFQGTCIRAYTNSDVTGVELCGALKNVIALTCGISKGLGYGDNMQAAIITRGMNEIARLGKAMGCFEQTFSGLSGIGDLIVTATSEHSRNNRCGQFIGKGYRVDDAVKEVGMVVEGLNSLEPAVELARKYDVKMSIVFALNKIVNQRRDAKEIMENLMARPTISELDQVDLDIIYENNILKNRRSPGMKRVITYGTFDLLHYGHINLLKRAKALGDYLIVCISTDEFNWKEKHKKTYFNYAQRKVLLESLRYVDLVIPEESWQQKRTDMHEYHIDTFVMGDDWKGKFDFLKEEGVEVVYLPRTPEISTSKMKKDLNGDNSVCEESKVSHDDINTNPV